MWKKMKIVTLSLLAIIRSTSAFSPISRVSVAQRSVTSELFERKAFITGNWKLNPQTKEEAIDLATGIANSITADSPADVALFVPFPFIETVQAAVGDKLMVGAEMSTPEVNGAFTGEVAPVMLKSIGVQWALAGHSERRTINKETNEYINEQCVSLLKNQMSVMLCIGETEAEFEKDLVGDICDIQLKKGLAGIKPEDMDRVAIAYEPVWAIGTGKVATPEIAQSVHVICRKILKEMYGENIANDTRILYGGSVNAGSIDALMNQSDIDGTLVGGASLDSKGFGRIINFERGPDL